MSVALDREQGCQDDPGRGLLGHPIGWLLQAVAAAAPMDVVKLGGTSNDLEGDGFSYGYTLLATRFAEVELRLLDLLEQQRIDVEKK